MVHPWIQLWFLAVAGSWIGVGALAGLAGRKLMPGASPLHMAIIAAAMYGLSLLSGAGDFACLMLISWYGSVSGSLAVHCARAAGMARSGARAGLALHGFFLGLFVLGGVLLRAVVGGPEGLASWQRALRDNYGMTLAGMAISTAPILLVALGVLASRRWLPNRAAS